MLLDYGDHSARLYLGDCLELVPTLSIKADALVSDPPYGGNYDTDYTRFTGFKQRFSEIPGNMLPPIIGDDVPFNPAMWLDYPEVVMFGYPHWANQVPLGTLLVWLKRRDNQFGAMLSDCEVAWRKGGRGVYVFRHVWYGFDRESERGKTLHPSQKPVELMRWIIEGLNLPKGATILDPYMGTGSTGLAAIDLGFNFIGIEQDRGYFNIAHKRFKGEL